MHEETNLWRQLGFFDIAYVLGRTVIMWALVGVVVWTPVFLLLNFSGVFFCQGGADLEICQTALTPCADGSTYLSIWEHGFGIGGFTALIVFGLVYKVLFLTGRVQQDIEDLV